MVRPAFALALLAALVLAGVPVGATANVRNGRLTWEMDDGTSNVEVLAHGQAKTLFRHRGGPLYSADGRWLLTSSEAWGGTCRVWLSRVGTGRQRRLASHCDHELDP